MPLSMHNISIPALLRGLSVLSSLVEKAEAFSTEKKIDPSVLFNARLAPDMLPFSAQIQRVSDTAKNMIGRLAPIESPKFPDEEASFAELHERIAKTVAFLKSVDADAINGTEEKEVTLNFGQKMTFSGQDYVLKFVLPNFYFHIMAAYAILRHNGVSVGKLDYLGAAA
jgi:hypothetical protein